MAMRRPIVIVAMCMRKSFQVWIDEWGGWTSSMGAEISVVEGTPTFGETVASDAVGGKGESLDRLGVGKRLSPDGCAPGRTDSARHPHRDLVCVIDAQRRNGISSGRLLPSRTADHAWSCRPSIL